MVVFEGTRGWPLDQLADRTDRSERQPESNSGGVIARLRNRYRHMGLSAKLLLLTAMFVMLYVGFAIKIPVFSYEKFPEVTKELGPEMKSTGEGIRFIKDLRDPFFRQIYSERNLYLSK